MFVQVTAKNVGGVFYETQCNCIASRAADIIRNYYIRRP